jgi:hypothetical protein
MGIIISINAGPDTSRSTVSATGSVQHVITSQERATFGLTDEALKAAVNKYAGKEPNNVYLVSPTPWGDLYKTYGWEQVQTVLTVVGAELLGVTSEPIAVKTEQLRNNSPHKATFRADLSQMYKNTTTHTWQTGGQFSIEQKFTYNVQFLRAGGGGETSFSYEQSWGIGGQQAKSTQVTSSGGVTVDLEPGKAVLAELTASKGTMRVRIRYNAYLTGLLAVNYDPTYQGHHFWAYPIGDILSSGGISNSNQSSEEITIDYYFDGKVELKPSGGTGTGMPGSVGLAGH